MFIFSLLVLLFTISLFLRVTFSEENDKFDVNHKIILVSRDKKNITKINRKRNKDDIYKTVGLSTIYYMYKLNVG
jgi:hypothetical protein